jgi:hypothetical protein
LHVGVVHEPIPPCKRLLDNMPNASMKIPSIKIVLSVRPVIITAIILSVLFSFTMAFGTTQKEEWAKDNTAGMIIPHDNLPELTVSDGPDAFGYYYIDSDDSAYNAPNFNWVDISGNGTHITFNQDDQISTSLSVGFLFTFYGQYATLFRICTNGWISFTSIMPEYFNRPIPTSTEPNSLLAAFWDDLYPADSNSSVYYYSANDSCIIEWRNFHHYGDSGVYTFEIILLLDGDIVYQYLSMTGTLDSHTIGIENSSGTDGLQYVYNTYRDETGKAILFTQTPPRYASRDVLPSTFTSPPIRGLIGQNITPVVRFYNNGSVVESFYGRVKINHNGELYNHAVRISNLTPETFVNTLFPTFIPDEVGQYNLTATTELLPDMIHANDTIRMNYDVYSSIYSKDFEDDAGSFVGNHDWQWGAATRGPSRAHSGLKLWGTILNGNYSVGPLLSPLISDTLTLGPGALMSFWHWYDIEDMFDGGNVKLSADGGFTWSIITPDDGYDVVLSSAFGNPIGGEPAFSGSSPQWTQENFDLSAYAGSSVIFRFDFGSDDSQTSFGWYIDDFSVIGGSPAGPGWIRGVVRDHSSSNPIAGAVVQTMNTADTTDAGGRYMIKTIPGLHSLLASAPYHSPLAVDSVIVIQRDTTVEDLSLGAPVININTDPIDTSMDLGQTLIFSRNIANTGDGALNFNVRVDYGAPLRLFDFGDELFTFDPQTPTGDDQCVGVEFDGSNFWVTARHGIDDIHKLYKFDREGNYLTSFNQNTSSTWGWRDLAWDGAYLYAADENELAKINPTTGQKIDTLPRPSSIPSPIRALAYSQTTDHFWGANFTSNIVEFNRAGQTVHSFANDHHIFGLAWDNISTGAPWLWVFSQDGDPLTKVSQFDPRNGIYTGLEFYAIDHNGGEPDLAQGACFIDRWDPTKGVLFCLVLGRQELYDRHNLVQGYEIAQLPHWISVTPSSGAIAPSDNVNLTISFDFSDSTYRPDSLYQASITIDNNSPQIPEIPVTVGLTSNINGHDPTLPTNFALYQNYPNPFNVSTQIRFALPKKCDVKIEIYNVLGQRIDKLVNGTLAAGYHSIIWNAGDASSGIYYYRLTAGNFVDVDKMILLK